ncbi:MAG: class I SAM-dependent methyltransferase [Oscillospiraceae bacterium]|nr:class I SAM-dependent methyltransferase [Oscillospiraceae bacterium]
MKKLPKRLQVIADFINEGARVADIGTDHGYLPVFLALTNHASRIIASDISAGSLGAARRSADKYNVSEKINFVNAPGLTGINENEVDTIVIAGVGGETIIEILEETQWTKNGKRLILQPQTKREVLCDYLGENGYIICEVKTVKDRGRDYFIMIAQGEQKDDNG